MRRSLVWGGCALMLGLGAWQTARAVGVYAGTTASPQVATSVTAVANCTTLMLDRRTGLTAARPCAAQVPLQHEASHAATRLILAALEAR